MNGPVLTATQLSLNYFELNQELFYNTLAEDVTFTVDAEVIEPGTDPQHYEAKYTGKFSVETFLTTGHFTSTINIHLEKLNIKKLDENRVTVKFTSIKTREVKDKDPVTYKYTGHYDMDFVKGEEGLLVKKIALTNSREIYTPKS